MSEADEAVALIKRLEELDPSDDYHAGEVTPLEAHSYYAAIDRAIKIVTGELSDWTDLGRKRTTTPPPNLSTNEYGPRSECPNCFGVGGHHPTCSTGGEL